MYLYGCAAVALIILVIACINYMNLATARATRRARSIGIRKILGASRTMLALQFLGEAILFALLALVLAAVIVEVVLKFTPINTLMQQQVSFDLVHQPMLALLLLGLAVTHRTAVGPLPRPLSFLLGTADGADRAISGGQGKPAGCARRWCCCSSPFRPLPSRRLC